VSCCQAEIEIESYVQQMMEDERLAIRQQASLDEEYGGAWRSLYEQSLPMADVLEAENERQEACNALGMEELMSAISTMSRCLLHCCTAARDPHSLTPFLSV
jgi:hypothetical protein